MNFRNYLSVLVSGMIAISCVPAVAANVFVETFDDIAAFQGQGYPGYGPGGSPLNTYSEAWAPTYYYRINQVNQWSFFNGAQFVTNANLNGALLLNESGDSGAASNTSPLAIYTLTGLIQGQQYRVGFSYWGDNNAGNPYQLVSYIDGAVLFNVTEIAGVAGSLPEGHSGYYEFIASNNTAILGFGQVLRSGASPIIDNILVSAVPEPDTRALLLLGSLVLLRRLRRNQGCSSET